MLGRGGACLPVLSAPIRRSEFRFLSDSSWVEVSYPGTCLSASSETPASEECVLQTQASASPVS